MLMSRKRSVASRYSGRLAAVLAGLVGVQCLGRSAMADPVNDLIEQGVKLRQQDQPAAALDLFNRANALAPSARTLAQMGLAEGVLHRWLDAEAHISTALGSRDTPWIENHRNRDALEQALAAIRKHIGGVIVTGPKGVAITINGKPSGVLPLDRSVRVAEGPVRIEGSASGYPTAVSDVDVVGGVDKPVVLDMAPVPVPAAPAVVRLVTDSPRPEGGGSRWKTWVGASIVGASLAAVATGIVWIAIDGNPTCEAPPGAVCGHFYDTKVEGWAALGAGLAGSVAGGLLIWSGHRSQAHLDVGFGSLRLSGHF